MPAWEEAQYTINQLKEEMAKSRYGESGIPPKNMETFSVQVDNGLCRLTCQLPSETIIDGQLLCTPKGVRILRKENTPPMYPTDGDLIANVTTKEVVTIEDTNVQNDHTYYYAFFPYSDHDVFNINQKNVLKGEPTEWIIYHFSDEELDNPTSRISYGKECIYTGLPVEPINLNFQKGFSPSITGEQKELLEEQWRPLMDNLLKCHPWMVKKDGTADYPLDPLDYTKKLDGTPSDINNPNYEGGAFVWINRIYRYEWVGSRQSFPTPYALKNPGMASSTGTYNWRHVFLSNKPVDENWMPVGFWDGSEDRVLEGVWIPIYYADATFNSLAGKAPLRNVTKKDAHDRLVARWGAENYTSTVQNKSSDGRARFFSQSMIRTLRDFAYLMSGTVNTKPFGKGFGMSFTALGTSNAGAVVNNPTKPTGRTVFNGAFYFGIEDTNGLTTNLTGGWPRTFYTHLMNTYFINIADPYYAGLPASSNSNYVTTYVSPYYKYAKNATDIKANYINLETNGLGISQSHSAQFSGELNPREIFSRCRIPLGQKLEQPAVKTSSTGYTDETAVRVNIPSIGSTYAETLGYTGNAPGNGFNRFILWLGEDEVKKETGFAVMLLPPLGYSPPPIN